MNAELKAHESVPFVQIAQALPPYMKAEKWAGIIGKTVRAVKEDLRTGAIARYQPVKGGLVYVNVIKEMKKAEQAADY